MSIPSAHEIAWANKLRDCMRRSTAAAWELGDLLLEGRAFDPNCRKAAALTGHSVSHLVNMRRASEAFPPDVRSSRVSWGGHVLMLQEPDDERRAALLRLAHEGGWQQHEIRDYLIEHGRSERPSTAEGDARGRIKEARASQLAHVQCPTCASVFPVKGHKVAADALAAVERLRQLDEQEDASSTEAPSGNTTLRPDEMSFIPGA